MKGQSCNSVKLQSSGKERERQLSLYIKDLHNKSHDFTLVTIFHSPQNTYKIFLFPHKKSFIFPYSQTRG